MITYVGSIIPDSDLQWYIENSIASVPYSSNTHQQSIISALRVHEGTDVVYITPAGYYPTRFKKILVGGIKVDYCTTRLPSCNLPIIRGLYNFISQYRGVRLSIERGARAIVCYMPFITRMKAVSRIKKKYPNIPLIVIQPDLVEHSYQSTGSSLRTFVARTLRSYESTKIKKLSKYVDGYVLLSEKMHERIGSEKPYIVQEAIYDIDKIAQAENNTCLPFDPGHFVFTYCGKLAQMNGIDRLIDAFCKLKGENYRLCICGDGELLDLAKKASLIDSRIIITGQVDHERVKIIEQASTVLINPRYCNIENAAYSFPSKLIEYLACAKPVISSHLSGIPSDYDDHVFYLENDSVDSLLECMQKVANIDKKKLEQIGKDNYNFVLNNKSSKSQGKKLVEFIDYIEQGIKNGQK